MFFVERATCSYIWVDSLIRFLMLWGLLYGTFWASKKMADHAVGFIVYRRIRIDEYIDEYVN